MFWHKLAFRFLVLTSVVYPQLILAAGWSGETEIDTRVYYNDNVYLAVNDEQDATALVFSPSFKLSREQADQELNALADISVTRYQDKPLLDRDEGKLQLDWTKLTERSHFDINSAYSQESSLNQKLELVGITDQPVDVLTTSVNTSWGYQLTETWGVNLTYIYTNVEYDEPGIEGFNSIVRVINFINYRTDQFSFEFIKSLTEKDQLHLTVSNTKYDGESNGLQYDSFFFGYYSASERLLAYEYQVYQLGYAHSFSELHNISLFYGSSRQDVNNKTTRHYFDTAGTDTGADPQVVTESSQTGGVYNINYSYSRELSRLGFAIGRDRTSESTGGLVERTFFNFNYRRNITERLMFLLNADADKRKADADTSVVFSGDRKSFSLGPSIRYRITKSWYVSTQYRYLQRDLGGASDASQSNAIYVSMIWRDKDIY